MRLGEMMHLQKGNDCNFGYLPVCVYIRAAAMQQDFSGINNLSNSIFGIFMNDVWMLCSLTPDVW